MDRYAPGVYQIELPTGVASFSLNIDNKRVFLAKVELLADRTWNIVD